MKKFFSFLFICIVLLPSIHSQDREQLQEYLEQNDTIWKDFSGEIVLYDFLKLSDNSFFIIGFRPEIDSYYFFTTDGKTFSNTYLSSTKVDNSYCKYKYNNLALFFADFDYDGKKDFITLYNGQPYDTYLDIYSVHKDELLQIWFSDYIYSEYQFSWIDYCIVNGKRGIKVRSRGESRLIDDYYFFDGKKDHYSFFYWSASEQRYILDETATQTQIKNAYCPEEYFAYNGLDFSKLDKALKKSDIKDMTPAQLRLMRNAIYARHGRVFTSVDLQSLWECYTWYKPNPDYNDNMLTKTDKKNLKLIQDMEKVTGTYVPDLPR